MICVTRLSGEKIYLNWLQVEYVECIPETKIRMMNGDYYLVKDSVEAVQLQAERFLGRCMYGLEKKREDS